MEAGDSGNRQSGIPTANSNPLDHFDRRPRDQRIDTSYREGQNMATATIISPSAPGYHQHHSSYNSGYPHSAPVTSIPGMISPVEPRRSAEEPESANNHRQSLPSISEVISGTKPGSFAPPVPQQMPPQSLPAPFSVASLTGPPRSFEAGVEKNQSPRTLHPVSSGYPRSDTLPAFSDPSRPALASRPAPPPLNTFSGPHHSPSHAHKVDSAESDHRPPQPQQPPLSAGHREQPPQQLPGLYSETGRLPPGQLPLSAYPASPRSSGPSFASPYDSQRPPAYGEENSEYMHHRLSDYKAALDKHYETYGYQDALQIVANSCRTGFNFAEAYVAAAREQGGSQPILSRMPTENEVGGLLNSLLLALKKLEEVREMIQRNRIQDERARDHGRKPEDEDVAMYNDGMKPAYSLNEVKKRRGLTKLSKQRAAPPGRCHSCNRIDTPEWRRGPDGARTLCNACGLHYAKLERKRQLDQRSLRPKPSEDRS
ncbi:uncharacterized protein QC763_201880 [Podospora pseudopauciseta]|uniref:GATA-type domain-containing protein n=2 Tax=Podospora TaxID=5144 RepID=A0ABR0HMJ0_9PEZI|nr:hypothetical protein QC763_201880 [Podospora pseudopauciseta]KAK4679183.1 hypothetical protein QC764_201880 [Podospora pseudoanserina]